MKPCLMSSLALKNRPKKSMLQVNERHSSSGISLVSVHCPVVWKYKIMISGWWKLFHHIFLAQTKCNKKVLKTPGDRVHFYLLIKCQISWKSKNPHFNQNTHSTINTQKKRDCILVFACMSQVTFQFTYSLYYFIQIHVQLKNAVTKIKFHVHSDKKKYNTISSMNTFASLFQILTFAF